MLVSYVCIKTEILLTMKRDEYIFKLLFVCILVTLNFAGNAILPIVQ